MMNALTARLLALIFAALPLPSSRFAVAQTVAAFVPNKMETVLYGAAYYWEYMPYERLDQDVELMQRAGINVVRLGESSWGLWEPEDGRFEYAWMDRVVDRMHKAGIKVIMGTPTYSVPAWMYKEHPEIAQNEKDAVVGTKANLANYKTAAMSETDGNAKRISGNALKEIAERN